MLVLIPLLFVVAGALASFIIGSIVGMYNNHRKMFLVCQVFDPQTQSSLNAWL
jgi:uncharacterized membrane protein